MKKGTLTVRTVYVIERRNGTAIRCVQDDNGYRCKNVRRKPSASGR